MIKYVIFSKLMYLYLLFESVLNFVSFFPSRKLNAFYNFFFFFLKTKPSFIKVREFWYKVSIVGGGDSTIKLHFICDISSMLCKSMCHHISSSPYTANRYLVFFFTSQVKDSICWMVRGPSIWISLDGRAISYSPTASRFQNG